MFNIFGLIVVAMIWFANIAFSAQNPTAYQIKPDCSTWNKNLNCSMTNQQLVDNAVDQLSTSSMVYPDVGIAVSTGTGWASSISTTYFYPASNPNSYIPLSALSAGVGIGIGTTGVITNTEPDQTVVLSNGTGISVSGTYPNFTITNTSPSSGGTVTEVKTSPPLIGDITSSGTLGIGTATTSTDGYLTHGDWNTFNNKQPSGSYLTTVTADSPLSGSGTSGSHLVFTNPGYISNVGIGTANTITYWDSTNTIGSLNTGTYPSLTELSYVKGVTSSIQTQINNDISSQWKTTNTNDVYLPNNGNVESAQ